MDGKVPIKEIIFNESKYSMTKKVVSIFFIILVWYFQITNNDKFVIPMLYLIVILGVLYYACKLYFYKTMTNRKDLIYLLLFIGLLIWGTYTFFIN